MNVRNLILGTMLSVLFTGCQHGARNDAYMELMGAQRRALEDRIYDLEFDHERFEGCARMGDLQWLALTSRYRTDPQYLRRLDLLLKEDGWSMMR